MISSFKTEYSNQIYKLPAEAIGDGVEKAIEGKRVREPMTEDYVDISGSDTPVNFARHRVKIADRRA